MHLGRNYQYFCGKFQNLPCNDMNRMTGMSAKEWLKSNEFKINAALLLISLIVVAAGFILNIGVIAGLGVLACIFFITYTIYGYVRVNALGPE